MVCDSTQIHKIHFAVPVDMLQFIDEPLRDGVAYCTDLIDRRFCRFECDYDGYVNLDRRYVATVLGRSRTQQTFETMKRLGIVTTRYHQPGKSCTGYRLNVGSDGLTSICASDRRIIETLRKRFQHQYPVHNYLRACLQRISIDGAAFAQAGELQPKEGDSVSADILRRISLNTLRRIQAGWFRTGWCARGRYYHEVTSLPKELRPFLRLDGEPLAGFDISNSQPFFLALIALRYFRSRSDRHDLRAAEHASKTKYPYSPKAFEAICQCSDCTSALIIDPQDFTDSPAHIIREISAFPPPSSSSPAFLPADVLHYLAVCQKGALYESLAGDGLTRDDVKAAMMWVLFGKPGWSRNRMWNEVKRRFAKLYPSIMNMLDDLKTKNVTLTKKHAHVSYLTQNLEATTVIGTICHRAMEEIPNVPIITIHDSFFTTESRVDTLYQFVGEAFTELFGFCPHFKPEANHDGHAS